MKKELRIVYFGTPEFAVAGLKKLLENNYNIVGVVTAPDKPAGRGKKIKTSAVKDFASKNNLKILQPTNLKSEGFLNNLKKLNANLQIIVAFRMLPEVVWNMPKYGTFNLHASLLPQYRGAAPINWAIINGEKETGVTSFFLQHKIDTGNIILQERIEINEKDNAGTLHDKLMYLGADTILRTVKLIEENKAKSIPQDKIKIDGELKPAPKLFKNDMKINWHNNANDIHNLIRGLSPYPTAWTILNGKNIKIYSSEISNNKANNLPGTIITDNKNFLEVNCKDYTLKINELQLEGKKRLDIKSFLAGYNSDLTKFKD